MKNSLLLIITLLFLGSGTTMAQTNKGSYLYLEVNKNLPVQVKLNDKIVPNKRKGYIIIPKIAEGKNKLEFNFDNPNFESHTFQIQNDGKRSMGLKLMRVRDNKFVIQDVVNKRVISDNNAVNADPVVVKNDAGKTKQNPNTVAKTERSTPERGVIKVYRAEDIENKNNPRKKPSISFKKRTKPVLSKKQVVTPEKTITTEKPKRVYAMYRYRKPMNNITSSKRYKNYNKAKRERRKAARKTTGEKKTTINNKIADNSSRVELENQKRREELKLKEAKLKEAKLIEREKRAQAEKLQLEKERIAKRQVRDQKRIEAKKLKKEKRLLAERNRIEQEKQEQQETIRLQREKADRKKIREEKRLQALRAKEIKKEVIADRTETKTVKLKKNKKSTDAKRGIENQKVINTEPISNSNGKTIRNKADDEQMKKLIRCNSTVKASKVADWTLKLHKKFDDEARTNYVKRKLGDRCISTGNLGVVLGNMDTQIGRYKLIRVIYPQIEDRANTDRLYKYFQSKSYVNKIKELNINNY